MLRSFLRFTEENYILQNQTECLAQSVDSCNEDYITPLPIKPGDVLKFIMNKGDVLRNGLVLTDIKAGLTSCGIQVALDIATITEGPSQLYVVATIPNELDEKKCYEIIFYTEFIAVDCSQFQGLTLQEVIDLGYQLRQVLTCELNNFLP